MSAECDRLIYPTVDRFIYDLADGLGQSDREVDENRQNFLKKLDIDNFDRYIQKVKTAEAQEKNYIELLGFIDFPSAFDGFYYPVKIGDTYALQMDCTGKNSTKDEKLKPQSILGAIVKIKSIIDQQLHHTEASIGESWTIYGQLAAEDQDFLKTAQNCYHALRLFDAPDWNNHLDNKGEFKGIHFYELSHFGGDRGNLNQNRHLLIYLFPYNGGKLILDDPKIIEMIRQLHVQFLRLFQYRNKSIWAYHQSRSLKADMKEAAQKIQILVKALPAKVKSKKVNLKELQNNLAELLTILSIYGNYLGRLEEQKQTIATNLENYKKRLKQIPKVFDLEASDRAFDFLEPFADYASEKYLPQIESDLASLSANFRLLENAIKTVEGIVQLEQTKSDRALTGTIAIASSALALSAVTATVVSVKQPKNYGDLAFLKSPEFVFSLAIGSVPILIALLCWLLVYIKAFLNNNGQSRP
ncbi:hypothetical protein JJD41_15775 [Oxynema sp. CENA135]|uniref:hypothetical protein n=1 Tax=Oxynema sp. CENA135 TaxID=984206 RepID=UPI00190DB238|nr:hypothetical protein [Oxynema sp. CENA135]MBK4731308.1 hypothetical protein [Oxynema sp. CENA135]